MKADLDPEMLEVKKEQYWHFLQFFTILCQVVTACQHTDQANQ